MAITKKRSRVGRTVHDVEIPYLDRLPDRAWEIAGLISGLFSSFYIVLQIVSEIHATGPSTLSLGFVVGNLVNIAFWLLYGVRFRRWAVWVVNLAALLAQSTLLAVVVLSHGHP
ncbi:MAG: hypothetical protein WC708_01825 [Lentisphaeria bacterium]